MRIGMAVLRIVVGVFFIGHGLQKLAGWFGGHGLEGTAGFFESLGLRPARQQAVAAGLAETCGGALLTLGFLTPLGAAMITSSMTGAILTVHADKGPWVAEGGYEYNVVLAASMFAIAAEGPGALSVDEHLGTVRSGPLVALAELGAGAAAGAAAVAVARRVGRDGMDPDAEGGEQSI
ncbi:DoxX family protein [Miltoncostaea marina]|uniref:DoxX family protein n=1 Tax=Miltoncostaea marina TaxID=2843215 RepID=UPI001C3D2394|nr:DoxX family protein [Miltoncostaea marina]